MKIKFGQYKGHDLNQLPVPYLNWILLTFNESKNKKLFIEIRKLLNLTKEN